MLTDSQGRKVDFKNTVIIMTSNVGARLINRKAEERLGLAMLSRTKATEEDDCGKTEDTCHGQS